MSSGDEAGESARSSCSLGMLMSDETVYAVRPLSPTAVNAPVSLSRNRVDMGPWTEYTLCAANRAGVSRGSRTNLCSRGCGWLLGLINNGYRLLNGRFL